MTTEDREPSLLPARMVNEFVYCPRLAYLEWVQWEWDDSADTIDGTWVHRRVDEETPRQLPAPEQEAEYRDAPRAARSVLLSCPDLGAIARIDLLEVEGRKATPVDFKRGAAPDVPGGAYDPERVQVCLQGLILRANGYEVTHGLLYFAASRQRVEVPLDAELIAMTRQALAGLREMGRSKRLPAPLVGSPKCVRCSLVGICLPDETNQLRQAPLAEEVRRMVPARDDRAPLYVQEQGATIGRRDERLQVTVKGQPLRDVRLLETSHVAVFGSVQVTTQAVRAMLEWQRPLLFFTYGGWYLGHVQAAGHRNVEVRIAQHRVADSEAAAALAANMVHGKIYNQRILLRRNADLLDQRVLGQLALLARQARYQRDVGVLLGIEGAAADLYFSQLPRMLRGAGAWSARAFEVHGRTRRPPRDELNATLSFLYALLVKDCVLALELAGFDVHRGFLHQPRYGRPSLALDLCEEFRPLIADSTAITVLNQGEIDSGDFERRARGVALSSGGRRRVITAYERRMHHLVAHPVFGYSVSYRRIIELQARLLRAVLLGELSEYRPFVTR